MFYKPLDAEMNDTKKKKATGRWNKCVSCFKMAENDLSAGISIKSI